MWCHRACGNASHTKVGKPDKERPERKATLDANHDSTEPKDSSGLSHLPHGHPLQSPKVEETREPESRMMRKYPVRFGGGPGEKELTPPSPRPTLRRYLHDHAQQGPGNQGRTATPTAAVVFALFAPVRLVQCAMENTTSLQVHGVQDHHLIVGEAVGIDPAWYPGGATEQHALPRATPP